MYFRRAQIILSLLFAVFLLNACDTSVNPLFREPEALTSGDKEDRLDFGCKIVVTRSVVDGVEISQEDEITGEIDDTLEILPVVDANEVITVKVVGFGKFVGYTIEQPDFVTMGNGGTDEEDNPILNFSSEESFIFVGKVSNRRGIESQCSLGVNVIEEEEENEDEVES